MSILSDRWIRDAALNHGMIEPFVEAQRREGCISYGLSSYGYDARVSNHFKIFTNVDSATVDPKDFAQNSFVDRETDSRFGVEGRAVSGSLKGKTLGWIDSVQCRWFAWAAEYPQTEIYLGAGEPQASAGRDNLRESSPERAPEMVLADVGMVTPAATQRWRREGFAGVVVALDEDHRADAYANAAAAVVSAGLPRRFWAGSARRMPRGTTRRPRTLNVMSVTRAAPATRSAPAWIW